MTEHETIYLSPSCDEAWDGRTWAADYPWDGCECDGSPHKPVKYVLATSADDLAKALEEARERMTAVVAEVAPLPDEDEGAWCGSVAEAAKATRLRAEKAEQSADALRRRVEKLEAAISDAAPDMLFIAARMGFSGDAGGSDRLQAVEAKMIAALAEDATEKTGARGHD